MRAKGFTLIEVILVIVVLAVAIPGLIALVMAVGRGGLYSVGTTTSMELAQEEVETVIAKKRSSCGSCGYANITVGLGAFTPVTGFTNYEKKTDVELADSSLNASAVDVGYKKITVTVRAVRGGGEVPDALLVTVVTNY